MHTRCTHCDTAFRITPEVLTYARGRVRCGQCMRTFDALQHLAEETGSVLVPATGEAQAGDSEAVFNAPDGENTSRGVQQDEEDTLEPESGFYDTEFDAPDLEAAAPDKEQDGPGDEEDTFNAELAYSLQGDGGADTGVVGANKEPGAPEDQDDKAEHRLDAFMAEEAVPAAEDDILGVEPAFPHSGHDLSGSESVFFELDPDTQEKEASTFGADHGPAVDEAEAAEVQQAVFASEVEAFDYGRASINDEDDTLDGDLDLAATNSWKLDEELLNTSTLPALPGLVEHPEIQEFQETPQDPVDTVKPKPQLDWDDTWDDMSFDDEHGIPLMEDLEEDVTETGEQAAADADSSAGEIRLDPAATLTEADMPGMDAPSQQQDESEPGPPETAWGQFTHTEEWAAESDVAELAEEIADPPIMFTDTDNDAVDSDLAELAQEIADPPIVFTDTDNDAIDSDLAELAEAIENAANMVADTSREPGDSDAGNLTWTGPERDEGSAANRPDQGPMAGDDFARVQKELEDLAQLVGATAGRKPGIFAKSPPVDNFEQIVRKRRSGWNLAATGLFALLLVTILGAQLVHYYRASLLPDAVWGPLIRQAYDRLGIDLPPDWELDRYDIRQLGGVQDPARPGVLVISISVRNQASRAQPFPVIRLVLEDRWGERIAKRDLQPADYLDSDTGPGTMMFAGQMIKTNIAVIEPGGAGATTFQVDACIQNPGGTLDCANQL